MAQFENVSSQYGAPMGRREGRNYPDVARSIRVFQVNINNGGYDDGGAYWGVGKPLFCATDGADYRVFVRADSRLRAIVEFGIEARMLAYKGNAYAELRRLESSGNLGASGIILRQKLDALGFADKA